MFRILSGLALGACLVLGGAALPARAAPFTAEAAVAAEAPALVTDVGWRGRGYHRGWGHRGYGWRGWGHAYGWRHRPYWRGYYGWRPRPVYRHYGWRYRPVYRRYYGWRPYWRPRHYGFRYPFYRTWGVYTGGYHCRWRARPTPWGWRHVRVCGW